MKIELNITIDDKEEIDELESAIEALKRAKSASELPNEDRSTVELLSRRERYVLQALRKHSDGAARRVIHREASKLEDSPFTKSSTDGAERSEVGSILSKLKDLGLARREKSTWYPADSALPERLGVSGSSADD